jgi:hypothetical protein
LRSGSVPAVSPPALHSFRSPTTDRSRGVYGSSNGWFEKQQAIWPSQNQCDENLSEDTAAAVVCKKFSGLQMEIWKKLFTMEVHPHRVDSGALASSSVWLACACQGCPKKMSMARRAGFFFAAPP